MARNLDYILTFSSFYKAMYAKDKLQERGIYSDLRKIPTGLISSCGQGLYIAEDDLQTSMTILAESQAHSKGVFQEVFIEGRRDYRRIK